MAYLLHAHAAAVELAHGAKDIAVQRPAILIHGRLAPPAVVHAELRAIRDGRVQTYSSWTHTKGPGKSATSPERRISGAWHEPRCAAQMATLFPLCHQGLEQGNVPDIRRLG